MIGLRTKERRTCDLWVIIMAAYVQSRFGEFFQHFLRYINVLSWLTVIFVFVHTFARATNRDTLDSANLERLAPSLMLLDSLFALDIFFSYKHALFSAEPGKEIEITTNKITTVCLIFRQFSAWRAYKLRAYKKRNVYIQLTMIWSNNRFRRFLGNCFDLFFVFLPRTLFVNSPQRGTWLKAIGLF